MTRCDQSVSSNPKLRLSLLDRVQLGIRPFNVPSGRVLDRAMPAITTLLLAAIYVASHHWHPQRPTTTAVPSGWFNWWDASQYLRAAIAWSHFDLRPSEHWYLPGYPILGAIGYYITPVQPFYFPNLFLLLATGWLFSLVTGELLANSSGARALGSMVFLVTTGLSTTAMEVWVTPWTTTPATAAIYASLFSAMRFARAPRAAVSLQTGLATGMIALFRPTEALVVLSVVTSIMAWSVLRQRWSNTDVARMALAGVSGCAIPLGFLAAGVWATGSYEYLQSSTKYGFEWRIAPLHWVELVGDPRPLWPGARGLTSAFPWIVPGCAGMILAPLWCGTDARVRHSILLGAVAAFCGVYLGYRDMHPPQLWQFYLYHYFKWTLPIFGLYAALVPVFLWQRPKVAPVIAVLATIALFCWRVEFQPNPSDVRAADWMGKHEVRLPDGLSSLADAVFVPSSGTFESVFHGHHQIATPGGNFFYYYDIRAFQQPGGLLLLPLRPLPAGDSVVSFDQRVALATDDRPLAGRQRLTFGLPCWLWRKRGVCDDTPWTPGPLLRSNETIDFALDESSRFRGQGWYPPETAGMWTRGDASDLNFRIHDLGQPGVVLELVCRGYEPPGEKASEVEVLANGVPAGRFRAPPDEAPIRIGLPSNRFGPGGRMSLRLRVATPRSPANYERNNDHRSLGLYVRTMRIAIGS